MRTSNLGVGDRPGPPLTERGGPWRRFTVSESVQTRGRVVRQFLTSTVFVVAMLGSDVLSVLGVDEAVLKPRVPIDQLQAARARTNPLPATEETIEKGKRLFQGKAFCVTCHGKDGKGLGGDSESGTLKGPLPRDFTDREWQAARTDGELFWILQNGSQGTAVEVRVLSLRQCQMSSSL